MDQPTLPYHRDSETKEFIFQQKLVPDDGACGDWFGSSVAIHGDTLVVGSIFDDDNGNGSRSAYIYHQDPGTKEWIMQQKLVADDGAIDDHFGGSVAIFGDTLVVGAHWDGERDMIVGQHTSTTKTPGSRNGYCNKSLYQMMEQNMIILVGVLQYMETLSLWVHTVTMTRQ